MPIPRTTVPTGETKAVDTLQVTLNCFAGGFDVVGVAPIGYHDVHVDRYDERTGLTKVRALTTDHLTAGTAFGITDYEVPLSDVREYVLTATPDGSTIPEHRVEPITAQVDSCPTEFFLRSVFRPNDVVREFCLGEINEVDYKPRVGIHTVIGRRDPVVIVDSQETSTGTLRFISQNRGQLNSLKQLLAFEIEPLLLQVDPDYDLGTNGVLYFMPLEIRDRWVLSDARIPQHVFEVSFIEVSRPPLTLSITEVGIKFDDPPDSGMKQRYPTFDDLTLSGKTFFEAQYGAYA